MKKILFILLFLVSCGPVKWEYVTEGKVVNVKHTPETWTQSATTYLYFENQTMFLYHQRNVPLNSHIYIYRQKGYFAGHETIFTYKLEKREGKYFIE